MARSEKRRSSRSQPLVEAVFVLRPKADGSVPPEEESHAMAQRALSAAADATGLEPSASVVFDSLHSFSVRAPKAFVEALARLPEVAKVLSNELKESPLVEPVEKKPIKMPE